MPALLLHWIIPIAGTIAGGVVIFRRFPPRTGLVVFPIALFFGIMSHEWAHLAGLTPQGYPRLDGALTFLVWSAVWIVLLHYLVSPSVDRSLWKMLAFGVIVFLFASGSTFTDRFETFWAGLLGAASVVSLIGTLFTLRTDDRRARIAGGILWSLFPLSCGLTLALQVLKK